MNTTIMSVENISKSYMTPQGNLYVLDDIDLEIYEEESLSLLGYSGCGKTTLLRLLCAFESPDSGKILLQGQEHTIPSRDVLMLFQDLNQLLPWKTVLGNICHGLRVTGIEKNRKKAQDIAEKVLDEVNLLSFKNSYPNQLSGGMKQRAAFARALVLRPKVLVMDEPFANLDHMNRLRLQKLTRQMCKKYHITLIFVTHDIEESIAMADRIVILGDTPGKVQTIFDNSYAESGETGDKVAIRTKIMEFIG